MQFVPFKVNYSLFFLFLSFPLVTLGQQNNEKQLKKGKNEIDISFTLQYYFNKLNVHNDGAIPGPIATKNMPGFIFSLDYHRITHYELVYGAGISFGQIGHDVTIHYKDWSFFYTRDDNPQLTKFLEENGLHKNVKERLNYFSLHPSLGYRFKLRGQTMQGWAFQADITWDFVFYLNGLHGGDDIALNYDNSSHDTLFVNVPLLWYTYEFGTPHQNWVYEHFYSQYFIAYGLNLSLSKDVHWGIISNINAGIKITYSGNGNFHDKTRGGAFVDAEAYNSYREGSISHNEYRARDFSIGLKLGIGLWPDIGRQQKNKTFGR